MSAPQQTLPPPPPELILLSVRRVSLRSSALGALGVMGVFGLTLGVLVTAAQATLKLTLGLADGTGELRQLGPTEQHQNKCKNDEQLVATGHSSRLPHLAPHTTVRGSLTPSTMPLGR